jgi:hypothetical protein
MTARFRTKRKEVAALLFLIGIYWALLVAPVIMAGFLDIFSVEVQMVLAIAYPGLMRAVILLLWVMVLVYPISYALQEIRIGQWEIMLSNNVSTRDMLVGMFLGKVPSYGLFVLFFAPLLLSPFMIFFEVSIIGQAITYLVIAAFALGTLWLSTIISTAIQAKIGDSSRGNDIAKAMGIVVAVVFLLPLYGLMYFAEGLSQLMGLDVFLILPSTWGADLITWTTILFNGISLPASTILIYENVLGLSAIFDFALVAGFLVLVLILGLSIPDRLFSFESGPRTETVTTVGRENLILRSVRKVLPGSFGILLITALKDFGRKAQNVSKVIYGIFLSILLPVMMNFSFLDSFPDPSVTIIVVSFMVSMMLGMICGITFGGIGFLESKDHLWVIKSTPKGVYKFMKARLTEAFLLGIPISLVPVVIVSFVFVLGPVEFLILLAQTYLALCGAILVGTGFTAINPAYENTKSSAFYLNSFLSIFVIMFTLFVGLLGGMFVGAGLNNIILGVLISSFPLIFLGLSLVMAGTIKLSSPDL